jgi:NodT family efflux transporter outer membrane factor (OMF) lipoprotein
MAQAREDPASAVIPIESRALVRGRESSGHSIPQGSGVGTMRINDWIVKANTEIRSGVSPQGNLPSALRLSVAAIAILLTAGCTVGPDFKKPDAPEVTDYRAIPLSATVNSDTQAGEAQRFTKGMDVVEDWWTLFHSKQLDDLIEQALAKNHDLKAAQAALSVARENVLSQRGVFYPTVTAGFSASHQKQSAALAPTPSTNALQFSLFTPQVAVSYMPDVFGLNRRTSESLQAQAEAVRFQMIATYTTLTSNVVVTAIQEASVELQIDATNQLIDTSTKILDIVKYQLDKGYASGVDVAAQEVQLAQLRATLPPLIKQSAQLHDLLATLAGQYPSQAPAEKFLLSSMQLPQDLPVTLPSDLVAQRPDVLQAESNLHAASAQIGVAIANRLPNFQLTGNAGTTALEIGQIFASGNDFWSLGAAVLAPIFDGGMLQHLEQAAKDAYVQSAEQYRSTVLGAVQNVADTLVALEQDAEGLKASAAAEAAAKRSLDLAQAQVQDGYAGFLQLLIAQQAYQQARINLVQAQAARFADTAALFQALGGGWWHRTDLAENKDEK